MLNYVDLALLIALLVVTIVLLTSTESFQDEPLMTLIFLGQTYLVYLMFRVRFAIGLSFLWCGSCTESRHLRFHFFNAFYAAFTIFVDLLDFFRAMIPKDGLF